MAESLLAILLVTNSAKGSTVVYRWPPLPGFSPRYSRPVPNYDSWPAQLDNPWRSSHTPEALMQQSHNQGPDLRKPTVDESQFLWQRPASMARFKSFTSTHASLRSPPAGHSYRHGKAEDMPLGEGEVEHLFGYQVDILARLLLPSRTMCHQKFELIVDDLAFVGHPVSVDVDGKWRFNVEKPENPSSARGRDFKESRKHPHEENYDDEDTGLGQHSNEGLQTFHLVFVLDLPDPSSSASGNLSRYFDIIYDQVAFTFTAVLYQEQVTSNFVGKECDALGSLKDKCSQKEETYTSFANQGLKISSIASSMKILFEAIKSSTIAYITINNFSLELQLPPYLDTLLLHGEDESEIDYLNIPGDEDNHGWGPEMSFGWRLPNLVPWKSLLLLDQKGVDPYANLKGPYLSSEDRNIAEGLLKFLDTASVTLSLADMASLLDWDLENQVYPIVRWLVYHRQAKIIDTIHAGLKTVFTLPPKFNTPLSELTIEFARDFNSNPSIPPLPKILSTISTSIVKQNWNHFFKTVVKVKELVPIYHEVVLWMLNRDLLVVLDLRVRIVATPELKKRVRIERDRKLERRKRRLVMLMNQNQKVKSGGRGGGGGRRFSKDRDKDVTQEHMISGGGGLTFPNPNPNLPWISLSPKKKSQTTTRLPSSESITSGISELVIQEDDDEGDDYDYDHSDKEGGGEGGDSDLDSKLSDSNDDANDSSWDNDDDLSVPSYISDPARASPMERMWLSAMSEGNDPYIVKEFELISQYFDGKHSGDEILYRAEINRRQLREVLHHYGEYLQTSLLPS